MYDIIIIGSGVAGLAAAVYAGRLNLKTLVIGREPGGMITRANVIENYPGFKSIEGPELIKRMLEHAKSYDVELKGEEVTRISKSKGNFEVKTVRGKYETKTIILCLGTEVRKLGVPGEEEFKNKGVHYCAWCDAPFYKNKIVAVIGGGDSAVKESEYVSSLAKKVYLISRSKIRAEPIVLSRLKHKSNVEIIIGNQIEKILGDKFVNSVMLKHQYKDEKSLDVDGVFVEIGRIPASEIAEPLGIKMNVKKEIIIDKRSRTNVRGIYAAGDITDTKYKQAITGVGEAIKAVYSAYEHIMHGQVKDY